MLYATESYCEALAKSTGMGELGSHPRPRQKGVPKIVIFVIIIITSVKGGPDTNSSPRAAMSLSMVLTQSLSFSPHNSNH